MSERVLCLAVAILFCGVNYYIGKAAGRKEERERILCRDGEDER